MKKTLLIIFVILLLSFNVSNGKAGDAMTRYEQTSLTYSGNWSEARHYWNPNEFNPNEFQPNTEEYFSNDTAKYTNSTNSYAELSYTGYGVGLITFLGNGGHFDAWFDGIYQGRFSCINSDYWSGGFKQESIYRFPIYFPCNDYGQHTLKIQCVGDGYIWIDAVDVVNTIEEPIQGRLLGFGDSWTNGSGASIRYETDYLNRLHTMLGTTEKVNKGLSAGELCGFTGEYGYARLESDVILNKPEYLVIALGFNDVRHLPDSGTYKRYYDLALRMISARLNTENMNIICCTPGWCSDSELLENGPNYNHATQYDFKEYGFVVKNLSEKYGVKSCEWYKVMNETPTLMADDGYHPNDDGHWVLACEIFQVIKAGNRY